MGKFWSKMTKVSERSQLNPIPNGDTIYKIELNRLFRSGDT